MNGEDRLLVLDEPVEFEKQPVEVQDFKTPTHRFGRNGWNEPQISEETLEHHSNRLDLETMGDILIDYAQKSPQALPIYFILRVSTSECDGT